MEDPRVVETANVGDRDDNNPQPRDVTELLRSQGIVLTYEALNIPRPTTVTEVEDA